VYFWLPACDEDGFYSKEVSSMPVPIPSIDNTIALLDAFLQENTHCKKAQAIKKAFKVLQKQNPKEVETQEKVCKARKKLLSWLNEPAVDKFDGQVIILGNVIRHSLWALAAFSPVGDMQDSVLLEDYSHYGSEQLIATLHGALLPLEGLIQYYNASYDNTLYYPKENDKDQILTLYNSRRPFTDDDKLYLLARAADANLEIKGHILFPDIEQVHPYQLELDRLSGGVARTFLEQKGFTRQALLSVTPYGFHLASILAKLDNTQELEPTWLDFLKEADAVSQAVLSHPRLAEALPSLLSAYQRIDKIFSLDVDALWIFLRVLQGEFLSPLLEHFNGTIEPLLNTDDCDQKIINLEVMAPYLQRKQISVERALALTSIHTDLFKKMQPVLEENAFLLDQVYKLNEREIKSLSNKILTDDSINALRLFLKSMRADTEKLLQTAEIQEFLKGIPINEEQFETLIQYANQLQAFFQYANSLSMLPVKKLQRALTSLIYYRQSFKKIENFTSLMEFLEKFYNQFFSDANERAIIEDDRIFDRFLRNCVRILSHYGYSPALQPLLDDSERLLIAGLTFLITSPDQELPFLIGAERTPQGLKDRLLLLGQHPWLFKRPALFMELEKILEAAGKTLLNLLSNPRETNACRQLLAILPNLNWHARNQLITQLQAKTLPWDTVLTIFENPLINQVLYQLHRENINAQAICDILPLSKRLTCDSVQGHGPGAIWTTIFQGLFEGMDATLDLNDTEKVIQAFQQAETLMPLQRMIYCNPITSALIRENFTTLADIQNLDITQQRKLQIGQYAFYRGSPNIYTMVLNSPKIRALLKNSNPHLTLSQLLDLPLDQIMHWPLLLKFQKVYTLLTNGVISLGDPRLLTLSPYHCQALNDDKVYHFIETIYSQKQPLIWSTNLNGNQIIRLLNPQYRQILLSRQACNRGKLSLKTTKQVLDLPESNLFTFELSHNAWGFWGNKSESGTATHGNNLDSVGPRCQ
jgi:hypothetical protein